LEASKIAPQVAGAFDQTFGAANQIFKDEGHGWVPNVPKQVSEKVADLNEELWTKNEELPIPASFCISS
jgi:hypothetical protein